MEHFTGTKPVAASHTFEPAPLQAWMAERIDGFAGPLHIEQFKGGQSNPTYLLKARCNGAAASWVMRSKPGPAAKLLPSAHAIEREYRVQHALAGSAVPVARMVALCEDEAVIGRAFYLMAHVQGRVFWEQAMPALTPAERGPLYDEMNRVIAALHAVDPAAAGLTDYGKPGNYFERQIARWSRQYQASLKPGALEPIAAMERLIEWLPAHLPASARDESQISVVHGDYRLDNLIFHPTEPRILAVLDWELSTLGHPMADFSYHCMSWHIRPGDFRGLGGLDLAALGIPDEAAYMRRYFERSGRTDLATLQRDWPFYLAYNLFRIAAILQGIARRVVDGTAASAEARAAGAGAEPMAELGWQCAQRLR
jgi:aminoglycoside phosphotransferase (APT) family kinase protein